MVAISLGGGIDLNNAWVRNVLGEVVKDLIGIKYYSSNNFF